MNREWQKKMGERGGGVVRDKLRKKNWLMDEKINGGKRAKKEWPLPFPSMISEVW